MACRGAVEDVTKYGGLAYSVEREFACPIDRMWHAWTDPIALESWYHPTTMSCVPGSVTSHAVVGGQWSTGIDVTEFGFHAYFYGWYTDVERNRLLAHTMSYTQDPVAFALRDRDAPAHLVVIDFEDRTGVTWVKFSQFGDLPAGEAPRAQAGIENYFDSLGNFLT
jgi:uncharacterized protein YndB with AHSA1/START domain